MGGDGGLLPVLGWLLGLFVKLVESVGDHDEGGEIGGVPIGGDNVSFENVDLDGFIRV